MGPGVGGWDQSSGGRCTRLIGGKGIDYSGQRDAACHVHGEVLGYAGVDRNAPDGYFSDDGCVEVN